MAEAGVGVCCPRADGDHGMQAWCGVGRFAGVDVCRIADFCPLGQRVRRPNPAPHQDLHVDGSAAEPEFGGDRVTWKARVPGPWTSWPGCGTGGACWDSPDK